MVSLSLTSLRESGGILPPCLHKNYYYLLCVYERPERGRINPLVTVSFKESCPLWVDRACGGVREKCHVRAQKPFGYISLLAWPFPSFSRCDLLLHRPLRICVVPTDLPRYLLDSDQCNSGRLGATKDPGKSRSHIHTGGPKHARGTDCGYG